MCSTVVPFIFKIINFHRFIVKTPVLRICNFMANDLFNTMSCLKMIFKKHPTSSMAPEDIHFVLIYKIYTLYLIIRYGGIFLYYEKNILSQAPENFMDHLNIKIA